MLAPRPSAQTRGRLMTPLRALAHRDFRLYFLGQSVSVVGSWIQQVALQWLVYRLTDSAALLGVTAFAAMAPQLVLGPFAGAWIDRYDLRKLLTGVQGLLFLQAALLALLTWMDWIGPGLIVAMSVILGVLSAFDIPLRQALIGRLMENSADLPSAVALNGMILNAGRLVGPPLAGLLIGLTSETICFAVNALTFLALMFALAAMGLERRRPTRRPVGQLLVEGLRYAIQDHQARALIIVMAVANLTASAAIVLLPVFAKDVLAGDAETLGLLWGAVGLGAFAAMVDLGWRTSTAHVIDAVATGVVLAALALFLLTFSSRPAPALVALALLGYGISVANVGINSLAQSMTPEHLRGRIISLLVAARFGFDALGAMAVGVAANHFGVAAALAVQGTVLGLLALWFWRECRALKAAGPDSPYER